MLSSLCAKRKMKEGQPAMVQKLQDCVSPRHEQGAGGTGRWNPLQRNVPGGLHRKAGGQPAMLVTLRARNSEWQYNPAGAEDRQE